MADVNWNKFRCSICLMLGLAVAAVVAALLGWLLLRAGLPAFVAIPLFLLIWAVLGYVVDGQCGRHAMTAAHAHAGDAHHAPAGHAAEAEAAHRAETEEAAPAETVASEPDRDGDGVAEGTGEGTRPEALAAPRGGKADDLKKIKGIGPKLEKLCNQLGFWHFDQIASWTDDEVAWVDSNLEGFRGRVTRDEWVAQARVLAGGGNTEFSKRVDDGDVPSSQ